MADTQSQSIDQSVPVDDVLQSQPKKVYIRTPSKEAPSVDKPIPFDDVFAEFKKGQDEQPAAKETDVGKSALISDENKRLQYTQGTHQTPNKDTLVGPAVSGKDLFGADDKDPDANTNYYKDEKGNYQAADTKNHILLRDPDSGEYQIHMRDHAQNMSGVNRVLGGLGSVVQEGFQEVPGVGRATSAGGRLASAGSPTRGQRALDAAADVEDTTGAHVPVPQNMVTDSAVAHGAANFSQALPAGSIPFDRAAGKFEGGIEQAADSAAKMNSGGVAHGAESAGETAEGAITNYAKPKTGVLAQRVSKAYDAVDAHVPAGATHDLTNTRAVAQDIQSRFEATRGESGTNKIDPTINEVLSAATDPKGITYQGLKDLRTRVGEMLEGGTKLTETGISDKQLRGLYKGMTDDMRGLVSKHGGPRGLQLWERANTYADRAFKRREELAGILGTNRSDEGIFGSLMTKAGSGKTADAKTLALARKSMPPDEWAEVASAAVGRLGKTVVKGQGEVFNPGKFVQDYDKLSDRGKAILFGENQRLRKALDSISELARSDTPVKHAGGLAHLITGALAVGHGATAGLTGLVHLGAAILGNNVLGRMLSKPATAESVAKWMQGYKVMTLKPTQGNVTVFSRLSQALSNDAAKEDRENLGKAGHTAADYSAKLLSLVSPFGKSNGE